MEQQKTPQNQSLIEKLLEGLLWNTRFVVLLAVIFSIISAIALFIFGSYEIVSTILNNFHLDDHHTIHTELVVDFIRAIDCYLIAVVLMIFGFGIYELFISKLDVARRNKNITILEIKDLNELKNKIVKVIIMVLIVSFFERVLSLEYNSAIEMLYFSISIFILAGSVFLLNSKK